MSYFSITLFSFFIPSLLCPARTPCLIPLSSFSSV